MNDVHCTTKSTEVLIVGMDPMEGVSKFWDHYYFSVELDF